MKFFLSVFILSSLIGSAEASNLYIFAGGNNSCKNKSNDLAERVVRKSGSFLVFEEKMKFNRNDSYIYTCFVGNGYRFLSRSYGVRVINSKNYRKEEFVYLKNLAEYITKFIKKDSSQKGPYSNIIVMGHSHGGVVAMNYILEHFDFGIPTHLITIDPISKKHCKAGDVFSSVLNKKNKYNHHCRKFPADFGLEVQRKIMTKLSSWTNYYQKDLESLSSSPAEHSEVENYNIGGGHSSIKKDQRIWDRVLAI